MSGVTAETPFLLQRFQGVVGYIRQGSQGQALCTCRGRATASAVQIVFFLIPPLEETDRLLNIIQMIALTADSSSGLNQQFVGINDGGGRRLASTHAVHRLTSLISRL